MQDLPLSFKFTCNYCHNTLPEQLTICDCGSTVCPNHTNYHFIASHKPSFFLVKGEDVKVYSETLTEQECALIAQHVNSSLNECKHIKKIPSNKINFLNKCEMCDVDEDLYCCLQCGFTGCAREQYGSKGNGHALKHSFQNEHFVSVNMAKEAFCYDCDKFVKFNADTRVNFTFNNQKVHLEKEYHINKKLNNETNEECEVNKISYEETSTESSEIGLNLVGIRNLGNTCFISSVMQLLAMVTEGLNLEEHFVQCNKLPLECLVCQSVRLLVALNNRKETPINEFIDLIYKEKDFVIFERHYQQDAFEFFIFFWNYLKNHLNLKEMDLETIITSECECTDCGKEECLPSKRREESFFLLIPCKEKISTSLVDSLEPEIVSCVCNKKQIKKTYIRILPKYLVLVVRRWLYNGVKNTDTIICDNELTLTDSTYYKTIPEEKEILLYDKDKIRNAMILEDNDVDKATQRLLKDDIFLRENNYFDLKGAICHKGETIASGHYIFVRREENILVLDDDEVKEGNVDSFKNAYIVLYK